MQPPKEFLSRMERICEDFDAFCQCYSLPHSRGLRINTLKFSEKRAEELPFAMQPVPFSSCGFRLTDDAQKPGGSPWHHAGAFYMQEPSAMSAATVLDPQPNERVLDMCAAPGGKTTQIAALMHNTGLLWSNEYVRSRAQILISNIERMGIRNCVVSSLHPDALGEGLCGFFDRVLVDAPCSGEGMFRREEAAAAEWSPEHVRSCAVRQRAILESAARCVAEGGVLVYSTCTFAPEENELVINSFLREHGEFYLEPTNLAGGRSGLSADALRRYIRDEGLSDQLSEDIDFAQTRRIYPNDGGEGHFVARMRKRGQRPCVSDITAGGLLVGKGLDDAEALLHDCFYDLPAGELRQVGDDIYILPENMPQISGLPILRGGVMLGTRKKGRIEPAHALFMSQPAENCRRVINLAQDSPQLAAFLHGEQIDAEQCAGGFAAVACEGVVVGFGKCSDGVLKNRYPKGLRTLY